MTRRQPKPYHERSFEQITGVTAEALRKPTPESIDNLIAASNRPRPRKEPLYSGGAFNWRDAGPERQAIRDRAMTAYASGDRNWFEDAKRAHAELDARASANVTITGSTTTTPAKPRFVGFESMPATALLRPWRN